MYTFLILRLTPGSASIKELKNNIMKTTMVPENRKNTFWSKMVESNPIQVGWMEEEKIKARIFHVMVIFYKFHWAWNFKIYAINRNVAVSDISIIFSKFLTSNLSPKIYYYYNLLLIFLNKITWWPEDVTVPIWEAFRSSGWVDFTRIHRKTKSVVPTDNLGCASTDRKRFSEKIFLLPWPKNLLSQPILNILSTTLSFLRQQNKSVVTINLSVKATDKSVRWTIFGRLKHKPKPLRFVRNTQ
jgi:hypothetical protein